MLLLAATTTTADRLREIPAEFWWKMALALLVLVALVIFLRKVANMNKVVLTVVCFLIATVVGFNWIYERSEPAWATPVVAWLAGFFPTKGPPPKAPASPASTPKESVPAKKKA